MCASFYPVHALLPPAVRELIVTYRLFRCPFLGLSLKGRRLGRGCRQFRCSMTKEPCLCLSRKGREDASVPRTCMDDCGEINGEKRFGSAMSLIRDPTFSSRLMYCGSRQIVRIIA